MNDPVLEPGYYPPFDSPIESKLAYHLPKYIDDTARFYKQYRVCTIRSEYRLDFVVQNEKGKFGFECDGKDYHEFYKDLIRDSLILGSSDIISIHRITGEGIHNYIEEALFAISEIEPDIFSKRGRKNLKILSKIDFELSVVNINDGIQVYGLNNRKTLTIGRLSKKDKSKYWDSIFKFVKSNNHLSIEELVEKAKNNGFY